MPISLSKRWTTTVNRFHYRVTQRHTGSLVITHTNPHAHTQPNTKANSSSDLTQSTIFAGGGELMYLERSYVCSGRICKHHKGKAPLRCHSGEQWLPQGCSKSACPCCRPLRPCCRFVVIISHMNSGSRSRCSWQSAPRRCCSGRGKEPRSIISALENFQTQAS